MFDYQPFGSMSPWLVFGFFHLVMAVALWKMAERVKEEPAWFAIVPLLNMVLLLKLARKPMWWLVLFFLPIVNIVALIMATMSLCERFGVDKWWGLVAIISPLNLVLYLYLAFSGHPVPPSQTKPIESSTTPPPPAQRA